MNPHRSYCLQFFKKGKAGIIQGKQGCLDSLLIVLALHQS